VAIGVALFAPPLLAIVIRAFLVPRDGWPHVSLVNFGTVLGDPRLQTALLNTLITSALTTVFSLLLGFALAFLIARTDLPGRRLFGALNFAPFFLSPFAGAMAWTSLFAPHAGLITTWMQNNLNISLDWLNFYNLSGIVFIQTLFHAPYAYLFALPSLRESDPAFEDAARAHGASFWFTLRHITIPHARPALHPAALIIFLSSAGQLDVPFALGLRRGIRLIPSEIYALIQSNDIGRAAAFSTIVAALTIALAFWRRQRLFGRDARDMNPTEQRYRPIQMGWPARLAALGFQTLYVSMSLVLPLTILIMVSLTKLWIGHFSSRAVTTANYHYVIASFGTARMAIDRTLLIAALCATIGVVLSLPQISCLSGTEASRRAQAKSVVYTPLVLASIIVGFGFLLLTPGGFPGFIGLVLIAFLARCLPFVTHNLLVMQLVISPDQEAMARASGASWAQTARHIVLPMLRPSLFTSWLVLFAICVRELGIPILFAASEADTISVAVSQLSDDNLSRAAALAVVQMAILLLVFSLYVLSRAPLIRRPA
jgi:iron(III) transport system permease protein